MISANPIGYRYCDASEKTLVSGEKQFNETHQSDSINVIVSEFYKDSIINDIKSDSIIKRVSSNLTLH